MSEPATQQYVFIVNILPAVEPGKPVSSRQVNTAAESIESAIGKVRAAFAGCEIRNVGKVCVIDIP